MQQPCEIINKDVPQHSPTLTATAYIPTPAEYAIVQTPPSTVTEEQPSKG